jgi:hypothetical protein
MQSVDGDTAQVPPQIAEELGVTCLTYITAVTKSDGRFGPAKGMLCIPEGTGRINHGSEVNIQIL